MALSWLKPRCLLKCATRLLVAKIWVQYVGFIAKVLSFGPPQQGITSRARRPSSCCNLSLHIVSYSCFFLYIVGTNFYALLEHISIHYRSIFLYIIVGGRWYGVTNCWRSPGGHVLPSQRHLRWPRRPLPSTRWCPLPRRPSPLPHRWRQRPLPLADPTSPLA